MNVPLLKAILILPGAVLVYFPMLLLWLTRGTGWAASFPPASSLIWITGLAFAGAGLTLMVWTMRLFTLKGGGGTPAPWEPIKNFIATGPYRYVRNPMISGVIFVLIAEALLLQSIPLGIWAAAFFVLNTFYFLLREEPELEARYGETYCTYKRNVPRWLPRLSPYEPGAG